MANLPTSSPLESIIEQRTSLMSLGLGSNRFDFVAGGEIWIEKTGKYVNLVYFHLNILFLDNSLIKCPPTH